jgi:hypothetical protein
MQLVGIQETVSVRKGAGSKENQCESKKEEDRVRKGDCGV